MGGRPLTAPPFNTVQPHPSWGPANPAGPPDLTAALESRAVNFCSRIRAQTLRLREGSQRRSEAGTRVFPAPPAFQGAPRSPPSPQPPTPAPGASSPCQTDGMDVRPLDGAETARSPVPSRLTDSRELGSKSPRVTLLRAWGQSPDGWRRKARTEQTRGGRPVGSRSGVWAGRPSGLQPRLRAGRGGVPGLEARRTVTPRVRAERWGLAPRPCPASGPGRRREIASPGLDSPRPPHSAPVPAAPVSSAPTPPLPPAGPSAARPPFSPASVHQAPKRAVRHSPFQAHLASGSRGPQTPRPRAGRSAPLPSWVGGWGKAGRTAGRGDPGGRPCGQRPGL